MENNFIYLDLDFSAIQQNSETMITMASSSIEILFFLWLHGK